MKSTYSSSTNSVDKMEKFSSIKLIDEGEASVSNKFPWELAGISKEEYVKNSKDLATPIIKFLNAECRVKIGEEYTHTTMANPCGSYFIDESNPEMVKKFYTYYKKTMQKGKPIYLTEKHLSISPIIVDLDFKFDINNINCLDREYTGINSNIADICKLYATEIYNYIDINTFIMYVQQRPEPVISKHNIKDGIHIIVPEVVTTPAVQYIIRNKVLENCTIVFDEIKDVVNDYNDIIDRAVIEKNNWMCYGSTKPDLDPYRVTRIYKFTKTQTEIIMSSLSIKEEHTEYVELFSIRNKFKENKINILKRKEVDEYIKFLEDRIIKENSLLQKSVNHTQNTCDDIENIKSLVNILSPDRASKYEEWVRVAWCLRNIDHRLIDVWHEFSKKCENKYDEYYCNKIWNQIKKAGLTTGSLHFWAKQDDPVAYKRIMDANIHALIDKCIKPSEYDIARVVHAMYKNRYMCSSVKNNAWWEYKDHRWQRCDCGVELRKAISSRVFEEFGFRIRDLAAKAIEYDPESDERMRINKNIKDMLAIVDKLKQSRFKDNIMKECKDLFYEKGFEEKLDSNINLLGFSNGVYDFANMEFRDGRPHDYISLSTHINYDIFEDNDPRILEITQFFEKLFTNEAVRKNVITNVAISLHGSTKHQRFNLWTGNGCFAKDTKILMFNGDIKNIQDIQLGDKIMGDDNTVRNVLKLYNGYSDMYEIKPNRGETFTVNGDHDLALIASIDNIKMSYLKEYSKFKLGWIEYIENTLKYRNKNFDTKEELIDFKNNIITAEKTLKKYDKIIINLRDYLKLPKTIKEVLKVYKTSVEYENIEVPIDPYILGCWLGDGSCDRVRITNVDKEVVDYLYEKLTKDYKILSNEPISYYVTKKDKDSDSYVKEFKKLDLIMNKHIPKMYKINSREVRLQLLAGIIDTDGHYQERSRQYEITQKNEKLIDDIIDLARSLGFSCYKYDKIGTWTHNGIKKSGLYYRINIVGDKLHEIPVKIERKKCNNIINKKNQDMLGFIVNKLDDGDYYGFELDKNNLFVMGQTYIVQKNSNGKSATIELCTKSFGDYYANLPVSLLTNKRPNSNCATPEIVRLKGKRLVCLQESSDCDTLNVGYMKELTGGDKILARALYSEPIEIILQTHMFYVCNVLPKIVNVDGGTARRLIVTDFKSKFCKHPNPNKKREFKYDLDLNKKFDDWKEPFIYMLLEVFKKYLANGCIIDDPPSVLKATKEYTREHDTILSFIEDELEKQNEISDEDDDSDDEEETNKRKKNNTNIYKVSYNELSNDYKIWCRINNIEEQSMTKPKFIRAFENHIGQSVKVGKQTFWYKYRIKPKIEDINDEDF